MTMLKKNLNRFNKQQEKCQSMLASIAANAGPSRAPSQKAPALGTSTSRSLATPIKFSDDTARLQQINSIRNAPIGSQIKRVIDLLREERQAFTPEQINERTHVDINGNRAVFDSLSKNPKVKYDGYCFSYKSKHDLGDKNHLLALIQKFPEGIAVIDLKDAYPTVVEDLQALKVEGKIWLLSSNNDSKEDIAYPNDPRVPTMKVDDDLKNLFRGIELPRDMIDIEKDLKKNGMKPATETAKRRANALADVTAPKPKAKTKEKKISKRTKLTNTHMPELFNFQ